MNTHNHYSHIHFVGIKGVGMAALARVAHDKSITVSGSDVADIFITDTMLADAGIVPTVGFDENDLPDGVDCVVYGAAHGGNENPQVHYALTKGIRTMTYGKAVQELFADKKIIAVAGTHGKTTTTAMLATILVTAGCDPSWVIGTGNIPSLPANGKWGKGEYAVVEADEYVDTIGGKPKFLHLNPFALIITSLDWDHPDVFPTHKLFINAFHKLMKRVDKKGIMVLRGDDKKLRILAKLFHSTVRFIVPNKPYSGIHVRVPGAYNTLNATFAARMAHEIGVAQKDILRGVEAFTGVERRLENKGSINGWAWYDDYAHHPTEIKRRSMHYDSCIQKIGSLLFFNHIHCRAPVPYLLILGKVLQMQTTCALHRCLHQREKKMTEHLSILRVLSPKTILKWILSIRQMIFGSASKMIVFQMIRVKSLLRWVRVISINGLNGNELIAKIRNSC